MRSYKDNEDVIEIDLQEMFGLLLHWLWLILICGTVTGLVGFLLSSIVITPQYESTTSVYILSKNENASLTYNDTQLATQLTKDYEELITSRYVLEQVLKQFGLEEQYYYDGLSKKISVENVSGTRIINITIKDSDPLMAQELANAIREVSAERITSVMSIEAVNVVDEANLAVEPSEPSVPKWTLIGAVLGMFLTAAAVIIRFLMDDTIKSSDDIENYLALSTLAMIPEAEQEGKKKPRKHREKYSEEEGRDIARETEAEETVPDMGTSQESMEAAPVLTEDIIEIVD